MEEENPLLSSNTGGSVYSLRSMFRKQDLHAVVGGPDEGHSANLKRSLSVWDLVSYGLASTLGTGIFVTVGQVAKDTAGPAIIFSFLFAGFASFLSALCYSEFASRIPVSGSAYSFAYISLGEVVGWFVGWNLTLEYAISASAVAGGWTNYFVSALESVGIHLPTWLSGYELSSYVTISPLSAMIVMLCTIVLLGGIKESATFNMIITAINLCIIFFFIVLGSFHVNTENLTPFFPFGLQGTWAGVGIVFFSYIGFDSVSTLAAEVKKPSRDLPIGIIGTLSTVTLLYVTVSIVLTGIVPYYSLDPKAPLSSAFKDIGIGWASTLVAFGSVTTITATTLTSLIGQPRIFFQMAKDGLMFPIFAKTNAKGVPVAGTIITGCISAVIALFFDLSVLLDMISIGTLLAFTVVCGGVLILRYSERVKDKDREEDEIPVKSQNKKIPLMVLAYFFACVLFSSKNKFSFDVARGWDAAIWVFFALPLLATFVPLCFLEQKDVPTTFKVPLLPFVPCLGILMNVWFIMSLSLESIIRLLVWTTIGMAIYFGYGIRNSTLGKQLNQNPMVRSEGSLND